MAKVYFDFELAMPVNVVSFEWRAYYYGGDAYGAGWYVEPRSSSYSDKTHDFCPSNAEFTQFSVDFDDCDFENDDIEALISYVTRQDCPLCISEEDLFDAIDDILDDKWLLGDGLDELTVFSADKWKIGKIRICTDESSIFANYNEEQEIEDSRVEEWIGEKLRNLYPENTYGYCEDFPSLGEENNVSDSLFDSDPY